MAKRRKKRRRPELDDRHRLAIELLASAKRPNREDIARMCGVCRRTLYRWENRADFQRELLKAHDRNLSEHRRRIKQKYTQAMDITDIERLFRAFDLI